MIIYNNKVCISESIEASPVNFVHVGTIGYGASSFVKENEGKGLRKEMV